MLDLHSEDIVSGLHVFKGLSEVLVLGLRSELYVRRSEGLRKCQCAD